MASVNKVKVKTDIYDISPSPNGTLDTTTANNKFESSDVAQASATSWTSVDALAATETNKSIFTKITQMIKNVRYLYNIIGTGFTTSNTIKKAIDGKAASNHSHDLSTMINTLSTGTSTPQDADYYVSQYVGGGTTTLSYHRRPMSALWEYIKSKGNSTWQAKGSYAAASHTHNYAGSSSAGGSANSAVKLATARTVSGGTDITMSFNYDGSANSSASIGYYSCSSSAGNTNNYPFHRIAYTGEITGSYVDKSMTLYMTQGYQGGGFGIVRVTIRTNNSSAVSSAEARWLVRSGFSADQIQVALYNVYGKTYADVFFKSTGSYSGCVFRAIANDGRGSITRTFTLVSSSEANDTTTSDKKTSKEVYTSIVSAASSLHNNQAYTNTVTATDNGTTSYANSAGTCSTASKIGTGTVGAQNKPVYINAGTPTACRYSLGNACSKTIRTLTAAGPSGWKDVTTDQGYVPDMAFMAYWNGAYSGSSSNLAYCNIGAFGTIVTKNAGDYAAASHTHADKTNQKTWSVTIKCATWSRICYIAAETNVTGSSFILNVAATRGSVVYNETFQISVNHSQKSSIVKIGTAKYSAIQIRVVSDTNGNCYIELYDNANSATNSTTQSVKCNITSMRTGAITAYTAFTDGSTIPSGYVSSSNLTVNSNSIQGNITWGEVTGKPSTFTPASHTHNYAGSGSAGGSANSAVKLDTATAGSTTQPVYFSGGKPVAIGYTIAKSVPADAKFTDTWRGIQNNLTSTATDQSLSAAQGKVLKDALDKKTEVSISGTTVVFA